MMRTLAALLLVCFAATAAAQAAQKHGGSADRIVVPRGEVVRIADPDRIPRPLQAALAKVHCGHADWLSQIPITIFRPTEQAAPVALVPCGRIVARSRAFVFDRNGQEPRPLGFVVFADPAGFAVSLTPGWLQWDAQAKTLTALQATDICPSKAMRLTYRFTDARHEEEWRLTKAERSDTACGRPEPDGWQVVWEPDTSRETLRVD
jgi:hypothetical protein